MNVKPSLSAQEVGRILGWSHKKVLTYHERGILPAGTMVLGQWMWTPEQIKEFQMQLAELQRIQQARGLKQIPWRDLQGGL